MKRMRKCNDELYQLAMNQALAKKLKNKRCRPFCLCPPDVMFVTRGSKNFLFYVFDSYSNLDCGQWYKLWIWQSHPMSAPATQSVDSRARASFLQGHFCVHSFFCWMVGPFLLHIATRRRDSQGGKPHSNVVV
jgi:hypothetical protein